MDASTIYAWTSFPCSAPCIGISQIHRPEWPGLTLDWTNRVNQASSLTVFAVLEEDAILGLFLFDEAESIAHFADISASHLLYSYAKVFCNPDDILL